MAQSISLSNGKWQTVADLEITANELEENLEAMNKPLLHKILIGINHVMNSVKRLETGIFNVVLKWFRLYLNVHTTINPDDTKLLKYFENSVPTVITYIIGCLQYKTKEMPDYHYKLLDILEQLLENVPNKVLAKITNFETGTIGSLWNPIKIVGDFNTQLKSLKLLAILLKQFDDSRQTEELKHIKWTNLNLFQDKLKTIVQETKLSQNLENASRDLLNNFNMNLTKSILVYSFYCQSLELGNRYTFYKPLNLENFWIDINYSPKTLSFMGRFKLYSKSGYENINVIVKIQTMKLENSALFVQFIHPGEFSKHSELFTNLQQNVIKFNISKDEELRLKENDYIIEYFNNLNKYNSTTEKGNKRNDNVFDSLKDKNPEDESNAANSNKKAKTSTKNANKSINLERKSDENVLQKYQYDSPPKQNLQCTNMDDNLKITKSLINLSDSSNASNKTNNEVKEYSTTRKLRDRKKFFTTMLNIFLDDDSEQDEFSKQKGRKKKSQGRKPRQSKTRGKQVCKVTPTIDLTNTKQYEESTQPLTITKNSKALLSKCSSPVYSTQECNKILKNVADIYNVGDTTYAKPCQSYRKFKTDLISNTSNISFKRALKKRNDNPDGNQALSAKKCRVELNKINEEEKENIKPFVSKPCFNKTRNSRNSKLNTSTNLFESQSHDITTPNVVLDERNKENNSNLSVDLTLSEENISNISVEYEDVRGINERCIKNITTVGTSPVDIADSNKLCTPRPTSSMNISDFNDSDMELTQINLNFITNENEHSKADNSDITAKNVEQSNAVQKILHDFAYNPKCLSPIKDANEKNFQGKSIALQTLAGNKASFNNSNDVEVVYNKSDTLTSSSDKTKPLEMPIKKDFIVMHTKPVYYYQQNNVYRTPVKNDLISTSMSGTKTTTKCQVTPTAVVMHQIQVSTRKSLIFKNNKPKKVYTRQGAKKNLSELCAVNKSQEQQLINLEKENLRYTVPLTTNKDANNNMIITPLYTLHKGNNKYHQNFENIPIPSPLEHHHINNNNDNNTSSQNLISLNETSPALDTTQVLCFQEFENEYISGYDTELLRNNTMNESSTSTSSSSTVDELMVNDFRDIINNHNKNIKIRLENAHHDMQSNISSGYAKKFTELLKAILQKSDTQKFELERFLSSIGRLLKEIQTEYETFIRKTKEYDINREVIKHILENFSYLQSIQTKDYEEFINQLNDESSELLQKLLKIFLEKKAFE